MLFQNSHELKKGIEKLIDEAMQFEITARDSEISELKSKLIDLSKNAKDFDSVKRQSESQARQIVRYEELLKRVSSENFEKIESYHEGDSWGDENGGGGFEAFGFRLTKNGKTEDFEIDSYSF